ncbi:MAG: hypothetical protein JXX28_15340 [Deltaproteobacteria bacterium]|nr:hypothetical protein [Deltaproteobacteria bacterium]
MPRRLPVLKAPPLLLAGQSTGRELLYPVATVVIGGLNSSGIAEFTLRLVLLWRWRRVEG